MGVVIVLAVTALLIAVNTPTADERFVADLEPTRSYAYPADPRNGGFTEKLFDFPVARSRGITGALTQRFMNRQDCILESVVSQGFGKGSTWHNAADTWRVTVTIEPKQEGAAESVCRVDVIRRSSWVETLLFRLRGR